ncbi:site-specific DNA-methyltransferase [Rossellomorea aquimaris]|uniref:Site-specific DNA-methyltransferase (Adenine-specific)/adenine-specific DNA-methyltransferase n=1 Tax=Rossellomorea aquimaris TaxID=189382 RepID=A0A366EGU0_9BACI|nr:site-specific DNA-methyltransferase [Rossellomorea aquimaris]RBP01216.1 site-specific DNA-methyltransferase (adenine-specific)/adenine-specific DNA-methyltransferase [Rossellomorea aquimaris]
MSMDEREKDIDNFTFSPIKGHPMLHWKGKRPFRTTNFYPAQLKETHGEEVNGWMNKIFWGDNLQVMSHLLREFRGRVDLVYIDPPFDSKTDYKKTISIKSKKVLNDQTSFEEKQYTDIWTNDEYLQFIYERLTIIRELLSEKGSIWVHCDWRKVHHLRMIMDEIFGPNCFRGHVIWKSMTSSGFKGKTSLGKSHDDLLYYSKSQNDFTYNPFTVPYSEEYIEKRFNKIDENGKRFKDEKIGTATSPETVERLKKEGKIYYTSNGTPRIKHYLDEVEGYPIDDVWTDIYGENSQSKNLTGYPTQKPEALLQRIIHMSSNPNDLVFDCFMGSGTTQAVSLKLGRRFIGADINLGAVQTTTKRLIKQQKRNNEKLPGFEVYNVNNYDIFRNPLQAKELLIEALEIQPLLNNVIYDGEKDGRMVKIMPVNRITTRADLNELITNFDYRTFEKRQAENPNQPVERLLLVCMGHQPDLSAVLEQEVGYKLDIEVVDILRNKSNLEFKRDSEANVSISQGKLVIRNFYPMNLLQKLSIMKENVEDWKELVESVLIDWNYDGAVLEPTVVDIPDKNVLVKGEYEVPDNAGTIRVKITDLLSESLEVSINND